MMRYTPILLALVAVGCSEAQMCRSQATSALRSLERQISVAEQNVVRGYELIERPGRREYSPFWCPEPPKHPQGPRPGGHPPPPGAGAPPSAGFSPGPVPSLPPGGAPAGPQPAAPPAAAPPPAQDGPSGGGAPPPPAQDQPAPEASADVTRSGITPSDLVTRGPRACPSPFPPDPIYEARPINVEAERAKLASLRQQRDRILPATQQALAACPVD